MKCAMAVPGTKNQTCQERLAAGNHRYSVGTETARFRATSRGGIPPASNCLADSIFPVVILRGRPPIRPSFLAAPSPARVRSTISSRSICARLAMTWKKNRPAGVLVSIPSVRLLKCTWRVSNSPTRSTRPFTLRPSRSSFQTTSVSPFRRWDSASARPGL